MGDSDRQQLNGAEWKGYVTRALEDTGKRLERIETKMDTLIPKVAGIGAIVGLVVSVAITLIVNVLLK